MTPTTYGAVVDGGLFPGMLLLLENAYCLGMPGWAVRENLN